MHLKTYELFERLGLDLKQIYRDYHDGLMLDIDRTLFEQGNNRNADDNIKSDNPVEWDFWQELRYDRNFFEDGRFLGQNSVFCMNTNLCIDRSLKKKGQNLNYFSVFATKTCQHPVEGSSFYRRQDQYRVHDINGFHLEQTCMNHVQLSFSFLKDFNMLDFDAFALADVKPEYLKLSELNKSLYYRKTVPAELNAKNFRYLNDDLVHRAIDFVKDAFASVHSKDSKIWPVPEAYHISAFNIIQTEKLGRTVKSLSKNNLLSPQ